MNVLITRSAEECANWTGAAVVFDVLRGSTTLCALLRKGERPLLVCSDAPTAQQLLAEEPDLAVFSEGELPFSCQDDSPYLAEKLSSRKPALVVADGLGRALLSLRQASLVLTGGFCNFETLAEWVTSQEQDVLLVPASLFSQQREEEDMLCAEAFKDFLQGVGTPAQALGEFTHTVRFFEFSKHGPKTSEKDLKLALKLNGISIVPQAVLAPEGNWAVCFPCGKTPDPRWLVIKKTVPPEMPVPQPEPAVELTSPEISLPPQQMDTLDEAPVVTQEEQAADSHENLPEISAPISQPQPAQPLQPEQETPSPTAEQPEKKKRKQLEKTRSRLKGFISEIVRSVKEEKEEIEESLRQAATGQKRTYELKSDDPMDALLKKSSGSDLAVRKSAPAFAKKTEGPSAGTGFDLNPQPTKATGKLGQNKKAIVLFSGGLDSTTCLYWALAQGYTCEALTVSYGQRHLREVVSAQAISRRLGIKHHLIDLNLPWLAASSLVDASQPLPDIAVEKISQNGIPSTYVPGRNLMFMAIAGSLLDTVEADAIIAGPNAVDFSGYPDCTPAFFKAAAEALNRGTRRGVSEGIEVLAPLMRMSKADIVTLAAQLKVPLELTWSCYAGGEKPCGKCDSCKLRAKGFADAGVHDPALD